MEIFKKTVCIVSLIAFFVLAVGFNVMGAQYSTGSGNDDWWIKYPDQSAGKGGEVNHPTWVLDALKSKPVLIYVHKSCDYCKPQTDAIEKIAAEFDGKITFYEISAEGSDARAEEALQAYDPNGGVMYVPLTVVVTQAPNSEGIVEPVWHSSEDVTGEDWIRNYVEDALGQYGENSAGKNK
jgi:thiol-disulfide isomerase/thioredoxin